MKNIQKENVETSFTLCSSSMLTCGIRQNLPKIA